jgi:hypothetical protein
MEKKIFDIYFLMTSLEPRRGSKLPFPDIAKNIFAHKNP